MKKIFLAIAMLLPMLFVGCKQQDITFPIEEPQFDILDNAILLEVIVPSGTAASDEVYICGAFAGTDEKSCMQAKWALQKAADVDKWGIYLSPADFAEGKSLADGFTFVSKKSGAERDVKGNAVTHTLNVGVGTRTNVWVDRWASYFAGDEEEEEIKHDGCAIYVKDNAGWGTMRLYMYGDVNNLNADWPGMEPTGTATVNGESYYYFDLGAANDGYTEHLIFNNGDGTQIPSEAEPVIVLSSGDVYYYTVNEDLTVTESTPGSSFPTASHDGDAVYVIDAAGWGAVALYMYGDENDLNGGWPGMQPTGTAEFKGNTWYYFDLGAANAGKAEHLIFNNNGGGTQIASSAEPYITITGGDSIYYYVLNADLTVTRLDDPTTYEGGGVAPEPETKEAATIDIYLYDATTSAFNTDTVSVYAWGASEIFGGWPGLMLAEWSDVTLLGLNLKYYHIDCTQGDTFNLIVNNKRGNDAGTQYDAFSAKAEDITNTYYYKLTDTAAQELQVQALAPRRR